MHTRCAIFKSLKYLSPEASILCLQWNKVSFPAGDSNTGLSLPESVTATSSDGSQGAAAASEGHPQQMPYTDDPYPDIGPLKPTLSELVQAQTFSSSAYDSFCLED